MSERLQIVLVAALAIAMGAATLLALDVGRLGNDLYESRLSGADCRDRAARLQGKVDAIESWLSVARGAGVGGGGKK